MKKIKYLFTLLLIASVISCSSSDCTHCTSTNDQGLPIDQTICVDEFDYVTVTDNVKNEIKVYTDNDTDYATLVHYVKNLGWDCE